MNYTQNERIAQVGDNTLVVGIDIGSDKHYARAFTERGMEISRKAFVFENTESGFSLLDAWMEKLAGENGKGKIMVGFEPTGHYWFPLGHHLEERGTAFVVVAPQHVKHSKELDDNTQRKDDRKDPRVIAKLVIEGRYSITDRIERNKMKLTMLGTGNALAMECYNTCFLLEDNGQLFMVDGGGGNAVLHQIRHAGYEAEELGIHNVWLRGFDARTVAEVFDLPENIIPVMMFAMGYPNEKARPNAWHFKRMPLEDFVTEL